ncbi:MAG: hypothetical protein SFX19_09520 [Alphaproteobacteria bacterium]|nr:hypothetical protein [Alphaproteobacteria bacterium]
MDNDDQDFQASLRTFRLAIGSAGLTARERERLDWAIRSRLEMPLAGQPTKFYNFDDDWQLMEAAIREKYPRASGGVRALLTEACEAIGSDTALHVYDRLCSPTVADPEELFPRLKEIADPAQREQELDRIMDLYNATMNNGTVLDMIHETQRALMHHNMERKRSLPQLSMEYTKHLPISDEVLKIRGDMIPQFEYLCELVKRVALENIGDRLIQLDHLQDDQVRTERRAYYENELKLPHTLIEDVVAYFRFMHEEQLTARNNGKTTNTTPPKDGNDGWSR